MNIISIVVLLVALLTVVMMWAIDHRRAYAAGAAHERAQRRVMGR